MLTIRVLAKTDADQYRQLRLHSFQEAPFAFSESYEDEKDKPLESYIQLIQSDNLQEQFVLGAFENETLIGIATFRRDQRSKARHKAMVYAMYVHPAHRGKAIGRLLLEHIIEKAEQLEGMEAIHLWVLHSNTSASGFYKRLGFESQGIVKRDLKYNDQYIDAEYLVRFL